MVGNKKRSHRFYSKNNKRKKEEVERNARRMWVMLTKTIVKRFHIH